MRFVKPALIVAVAAIMFLVLQPGDDPLPAPLDCGTVIFPQQPAHGPGEILTAAPTPSEAMEWSRPEAIEQGGLPNVVLQSDPPDVPVAEYERENWTFVMVDPNDQPFGRYTLSDGWSMDLRDPNCLTQASIRKLAKSGRICKVLGHQWRWTTRSTASEPSYPVIGCRLCEYETPMGWEEARALIDEWKAP